MDIPTALNNMFVLAVPILEKIIRPIIIYFALIIGLRLAGKRELAQLNPFDLVVLLTLSNTVQNAIIGNDNTITGGIIGAATLLIVNTLVVRFVVNNPKADKLIAGGEDILIDNGEVQHKTLENNLVSVTDLQIAAHKQGFDALDEIERAVLEPGGGISFFRKKPDPRKDTERILLDRIDDLTVEVKALRAEIREQRGT